MTIFSFVLALGHAPKMYLLGVIFDKACLQWQQSCDGEIGACWIYDTNVLAIGLTLVCLTVKVFAVVFFVLALVCYRPSEDNGNNYESFPSNHQESVNSPGEAGDKDL